MFRTTRTKKTFSLIAVLAVLAAGALALAGCSTTASTDSESDDMESMATTLTTSDTWVKAIDSGMTAAFGMVENPTDADITIVSATTSASDMTELHETLENESGDMVMQPIEGGFTVPAGGMLMLEPGGNHIMIMGVTDPILAGDDVTVTLTLDDGSTVEFTAPAKDYSGANENYEGDDDMDDGDMDHDDMEMNE
ncbi:copper chaperone PCu(A)C [Salinibacterium sp. SWN1162]|uniref:copper chaperone PCu(A)C n=1 Tax=Salinibacterium sp. SWN1162 TaxID=2792053 RepID=UPI0018CE35E1|nr:copper chaperone PCu(A)C [Salinibacterium sp. SWN1162]MBH0008606.1 copper chaperone PCu(A)C [Salinibacterium sp. SWN1162]